MVVGGRGKCRRDGEIVRQALAGNKMRRAADEATVKTFYRENSGVRLQPNLTIAGANLCANTCRILGPRRQSLQEAVGR